MIINCHMASSKFVTDYIANYMLRRYRQRQIALHVQYEGRRYSGFAYQEVEETVEREIFEALVKLRLIESRQVFYCSIGTQLCLIFVIHSLNYVEGVVVDNNDTCLKDEHV